MTSSNTRAARIGFIALALFWLWLALIAAPPSGYTIDDFFYLAAARNFWEGGGLFFDNGFAALGSEDLKLWFLVKGPGGLTPQYPVGYALLAAPAQALLGVRGFFVINALAALGVVWATWRLGILTLKSRREAGIACVLLAIASFLPEYANGVWPHAAASLPVMLATLLYAGAEAREGRGLATRAALAGLIGGLGLTLRVDVALLAPGLLIWTALCARRPAALILWGALGAAPALALGAWVNLLRFGSFNPLSYGPSRGGSIDAGAYAGPAAAMLAALTLALALRLAPRRRRAIGIAATAAAALAIALIPQARDAASWTAHGLWTLLIDLQAYSKAGLVRSIRLDEAGDYYLFVGQYKKALAQSLPWLGLAAAALPGLARGPHRKGLALFFLIFGFWVAPFVWREWHGGLSNNLRYFLPVLPMAALAAACGWRRLSDWAAGDDGGGAAMRLAALAIVGIACAASLWWGRAQGLASGPYMMLSFSKQVFAALSGAALLAVMAPGIGLARLRPLAAGTARLFAVVGVALALLTAHLHDLRKSFARRQMLLEVTRLYADLPGDSTLLTIIPQSFLDYFMRPDTHVALKAWGAAAPDPAPALARLEAGGRVFVLFEAQRDEMLAAAPRLRASGPIKPGPAALRMFELTLK